MPQPDAKLPLLGDIATCFYRNFTDDIPSKAYLHVTTALVSIAAIVLVLVSGTQALMRDEISLYDRYRDKHEPAYGQQPSMGYLVANSARWGTAAEMSKGWAVVVVAVPSALFLLIIYAMLASRLHSKRRANAEQKTRCLLTITMLNDNLRIERVSDGFRLTGVLVAKTPSLMAAFNEMQLRRSEQELLSIAAIVPAIRMRFSCNSTGM